MAEEQLATRHGLIVAVAIGLCGALLLSGGWLLWSGYRAMGHPVDCSELTQEECSMEQGIEDAWARRQAGVGSILTSLGTVMGFALWLTERRRTARSNA